MMWLSLSIMAFLAAQEIPTFGTTVVSSSGFRGQVYHLKPETEFLPNLEKLKPVMNEFLVPEGVTDLKPGKIEKIKSAANLPEAGPTIRRFP